eukprot:CAMPEP_0195530914 /NCGR_PEP_ID=MMETSP0794_2-20130614/34038_1 /TAXON_ID=515487 /ORGANISM="Stephanopyxis turris, Strain CCMP 815" /LENGTH=336 /DNA_ID=CAMNT_0040662535 /DNA_START=13 /DNA_END=1023 /DNA_ORIENTATION=+
MIAASTTANENNTTSTIMEPSSLSLTPKTNEMSSTEEAYLFVEDEVNYEEVYEKAIFQTLLWVAAACAYGASLYAIVSPEAGEEFFAGYIVEQSLSVDNLFVFLLLFDYFKVPLENQSRVLNWGIIGAIVLRGFMISVGAVALEEFHGILLVFASFLVYSSVSTIMGVLSDEEEEEEDMGEDMIVIFSRKVFSSTDKFDGDKFFTIENGKNMATPLFLCMVAVEISDVVFAVDSIPAVFGVTEDPLIVFSSNMFAILGLRALYTILSKAAADLEYLEPAVAIVLGFIGCKMIAEYFGYVLPTSYALAIVSIVLSSGIGFSVLANKVESEAEGGAKS